MKDTAQLRDKMLMLWRKLDSGEISHTEARVHIGMARTVLDTLKVEIAAAHLNQASVPPVAISKSAPTLTLTSSKKRAA